MCRVRSRPDIHSVVTAKADDAPGHDAFLSFRPMLTGLHIGIGKRAPTERRRRVYPPSGTLPVGEPVPGKKQARHSLGCNSKG